ncbi:unnamed protein product [Closterium sp. NIES-54]
MTAVQANPTVLLLDSGCSYHLMGTKEAFVEMKPVGDVKHVRGFNEALQSVKGHGIVALREETGKHILVLEVPYVPGVHANLLSAGQLKDSGVKLQDVGDEMLLVSVAGDVLGRAKYTGRALCTDLRPCSQKSLSAPAEVVALRTIASATKSMLDMWHARLVHIGVTRSRARRSTSGKLARHTFPDQGLDAENALDVVHIDLCGPFRVAANYGSFYFLLLKDRKTRYVWVRPIAKKSDSLVVFKKWPKLQRDGKMAPKAWWGLHLGVSPESKGWEVLDLTDNKVVTTVEAIFYETMSLEAWKEEHGPISTWKPIVAPTDPSSTTTPLLAVEDDDVEDVTPPSAPTSTSPLPLVADLPKTVSPSATQSDDSNVVEFPVEDVKAKHSSRPNLGKLAEKLSYHACLPSTAYSTLLDEAEDDVDMLELDPDMHADPEHRWDIVTMTVKEALASWKGKVVKAAMDEEIKSLITKGTWELVERLRGVNIMKNRWVLMTKYHVDDTVAREKARLVVKGFTQVYDADYDKTYALVGSYVTLQIFLSIVAVLDLHLMQLDMKTVFLQSKLDHVLYMYRPDYYNNGTGRVCKLLKSLYGLKQSLLLWYRALDDMLTGANWKKVQVNEALYFKVGDNGLACWVVVYVEDLLSARSSTAMLKELLEAAFELCKISPVEKYLGLEIVRDRPARKFWLHQQL